MVVSSIAKVQYMKHKCTLTIILFLFGLSYGQITIAVTQLSSKGLDEQEAHSLTDALRSELGKNDEFHVIERTSMEEILKEQGFQQSGACSEASCAITIGQLLAVKYMVLGNVGKVGKTYTMNVRIVDVGTGSILRDITEYHRGEVDGLLTELLPVIVKNLSLKKTAANENEAKRNTRKPFIITSIITAGLVAIATPVYFLSRDDGDKETDDSDIKDLIVQW